MVDFVLFMFFFDSLQGSQLPTINTLYDSWEFLGSYCVNYSVFEKQNIKKNRSLKKGSFFQIGNDKNGTFKKTFC